MSLHLNQTLICVRVFGYLQKRIITKSAHPLNLKKLTGIHLCFRQNESTNQLGQRFPDSFPEVETYKLQHCNHFY